MPDRLLYAIIVFVVVNILSVAILFQAFEWDRMRTVKRVLGIGCLLSLLAFAATFIFWKDSFLAD